MKKNLLMMKIVWITKKKEEEKEDSKIIQENIKENDEKKEEEKDAEIEIPNNLTEIKTEKETANPDEKENNDISNMAFSDDKKSLKLIKPIIIW